MPFQDQTARRISSILTLPASGTGKIYVGGDYFQIKAMSADCLLSVNDEEPAPATVGDSLQDAKLARGIRSLEFTNNTANENVILVIHGLGEHRNTANVTIDNPNFTLTSDQVADLKQVTLDEKSELIGTPTLGVTPTKTLVNNATVDFNGVRSIYIENIGSVDITVNSGVLEPNKSISFDLSGGRIVSGADTLNVTVSAIASLAEVWSY